MHYEISDVKLLNIYVCAIMCCVAFKLQSLSKNYSGSLIIISCSPHKQNCPSLKQKQYFSHWLLIKKTELKFS